MLLLASGSIENERLDIKMHYLLMKHICGVNIDFKASKPENCDVFATCLTGHWGNHFYGQYLLGVADYVFLSQIIISVFLKAN